jgi:tryptophan halogenase
MQSNNISNFTQQKTLGVLGGGTAGYFTALFLKKKFPEATVTVVESSKIPIIGVGEATTPLMLRFLHQTLGFSVQEFFKETKPTLKLGVKFNWGKPGNYHYSNPFGGLDSSSSIFYKGDLEYASITSRLMAQNKTPFLFIKDKVKPIYIKNGMAYHIDNQLLVAYLKKKLHAAGCLIIDATIKDVIKRENGLEIDYFISDDQQKLSFDTYFDCSGFQSLLLSKTMEANWIDYGKSLKTNAAVLGKSPIKGGIKAYTTATTLDHGWLWETPTQEENHLGYVFSESFCDEEAARNELRKHCPEINEEKVVRFRSGRYEKSWIGNVIGIGNAFAFIEPLESTGIHMILFQLNKFFKYVTQAKSIQEARILYNNRTNESWDNLKWFIALHFKFNFKLNTPFWRNVREETDLSGIQDYLDYFHEKGPIFQEKMHPIYQKLSKDAIFGPFSFDLNLLGCGLGWEQFLKHKKPSEFRLKQMALDDLLVNQAISHESALRYLESEVSS